MPDLTFSWEIAGNDELDALYQAGVDWDAPDPPYIQKARELIIADVGMLFRDGVTFDLDPDGFETAEGLPSCHVFNVTAMGP